MEDSLPNRTVNMKFDFEFWAFMINEFWLQGLFVCDTAQPCRLDMFAAVV